MPSPSVQRSPSQIAAPTRFEVLPVLSVAAAIALLHLFTNGRYGFHRDELQFLADARHLDWGFVAYPPLAPFLARVSLSIFGVSYYGLRLFSVAAQCAAIVVTSLMVCELGGSRWAQVTAALAVAFSAIPLMQGTMFQYTSFDYLWWVLIAWLIIRLLRTQNPRWWLAIGAAIGLGLLAKYSIVFYIAGILAGVVFTPARQYLKSVWFWAGAALALLIFLPNFVWLEHHDFISYRFLQSIHQRDIAFGVTRDFLLGQILQCINLFAAPLAVIGLVSFLRDPRYRMLGWMYLVPLTLFFFSNGRDYYLAPAYPMLIAMGAVVAERWIGSASKVAAVGAKARQRDKQRVDRRSRARLSVRAVEAVLFAGFALYAAWLCAIFVPLASRGPLRDFAIQHNFYMREEFGWGELVRTVAAIRDSLPAEQQSSVGVLVGNYGEEGAIEMLGPAYHLPAPIGLMNSAWLRSYPTPPPTTLIVLGWQREIADGAFTGCRLIAQRNGAGVQNEESLHHPDIFVCGPPRLPWADFWREYQTFG